MVRYLLLFSLGLFCFADTADAQLLCRLRSRLECNQPVRSVVRAVLPPYSVPVVVCQGTICKVAPTAKPETVVAEALPSASVQSSTVTTQSVLSDRIAFRRALMEATRKQYRADKIGIAEFLLIAGASRNPATLDKLMASVQESATEQGLIDWGAIDWDALISFIEKLIPIIIKLIGLFG